MTLLFIIIVLSVFGGIIYMGSHKTFEERKSRIINLYSSVLSDMNIDFRDGRIHTTNIHDISRSIQNLTNEIESTAKKIQKESPENQKWLMDIICEFNTQLRIWIDRHTDELEMIEADIRTTETDTISEKAVLELAYTRLDIHKNIFERI